MNQAALHNNKLLEKEHDNAERGAALVGATGAVVGTAMEHAMANGLPKDEWLVYKDALLRGKTVVIALPNDEARRQPPARSWVTA